MGTIQDALNKFKSMQRELTALSGKTFTIIPDSNGMIDKQCPKEECGSYFKVHHEDWSNIFKDEEVFCPFCRNRSLAKEFYTSDQREAVINSIRTSIVNSWNHGSSISLNNLTVESREKFELKIKCEKCDSRYSVIGAAYFCPCCGFNSVERNALESINKVIFRANEITSIKTALDSTLPKDESATLITSILEHAISHCISTLQSFSEVKYNQASDKPAPSNAFQNFEKGNLLWLKLLGKGYETWLTEDECRGLLIFIQRRHLLEHKGGVVDSKYLTITKDNKYSLNDRIIINPSDVKTIGNIILKVIEAINKDLTIC